MACGWCPRQAVKENPTRTEAAHAQSLRLKINGRRRQTGRLRTGPVQAALGTPAHVREVRGGSALLPGTPSFPAPVHLTGSDGDGHTSPRRGSSETAPTPPRFRPPNSMGHRLPASGAAGPDRGTIAGAGEALGTQRPQARPAGPRPALSQCATRELAEQPSRRDRRSVTHSRGPRGVRDGVVGPGAPGEGTACVTGTERHCVRTGGGGTDGARCCVCPRPPSCALSCGQGEFHVRSNLLRRKTKQSEPEREEGAREGAGRSPRRAWRGETGLRSGM